MKINWVTILLIIVSVLVTLQLSSLLKKNPTPDKDLVKQIAAMHDSLTAANNRLTEEKVKRIESELSEAKSTIQSLTQQKQQIIIREKQVPITVNNYTADELSSAAEEWAER